jgi:HSP20 family protein
MGDLFFDRLYPEYLRDAGEEMTLSVDFTEKDGKYYLTAELPGVDKENISISIEDGYVTLSGKKEEKKEEKRSDYYLKETRYGSFKRSFRLPGKVAEDKVDATYKNGVLTVVMPHEKEAETKKIEIH